MDHDPNEPLNSTEVDTQGESAADAPVAAAPADGDLATIEGSDRDENDAE